MSRKPFGRGVGGRHGHGDGSGRPVSSLPTRLSQHQASGQPNDNQSAGRGGSGIEPVAVMNRVLTHNPHAFQEVLPSPNINPVVFAGDIRYDHSKIAGQRLPTVVTRVVPQGQVLVITDAYFYAVGPGSGMNAAPVELESPAVAGLLRFELLFNGRTPGTIESSLISPYADVGQAASPRSGWSWLERTFGPERAAGFALYAKENERIEVVCNVDEPPRFPLSKVGAHIHAFSMAQGMFEEIWKR